MPYEPSPSNFKSLHQFGDEFDLIQDELEQLSKVDEQSREMSPLPTGINEGFPQSMPYEPSPSNFKSSLQFRDEYDLIQDELEQLSKVDEQSREMSPLQTGTNEGFPQSY